MARRTGGADQASPARELLRTEKTAEELGTALAVLLPLDCGLSLAQTAKTIVLSVGTTCARPTARWRDMRGRNQTTLECEASIATRDWIINAGSVANWNYSCRGLRRALYKPLIFAGAGKPRSSEYQSNQRTPAAQGPIAAPISAKLRPTSAP